MNRQIAIAALASCWIIVGCQDQEGDKANAEVKTKVYNSAGESLGEVTFSAGQEGTLVTGKLYGLSANSTHGFHLHKNGLCEGDFKSAGGHFNPEDHEHGEPGVESHAGDLGNLHSNEKGMAAFTYISKDLKVDSGPNGVLGKSIVIHAGEDDFKSQPSGDSGARIGCGVIKSTETVYSE